MALAGSFRKLGALVVFDGNSVYRKHIFAKLGFARYGIGCRNGAIADAPRIT